MNRHIVNGYTVYRSSDDSMYEIRRLARKALAKMRTRAFAGEPFNIVPMPHIYDDLCREFGIDQAPRCIECGPGYRVGDDGCRHVAADRSN